ncbi:TlpA disulfide reductase family protein [Marinomonas transparens]|uniref:TlpA family protein disulfide reductase n=1 Tax=Marinomonas transparens TaxID=2795388 RepID=A0A934JQT6_9GAMM|nr:TlpA disulfide reductase family protein [Marinomonas transparens]MBJ7538113.1 TlpA family protein disulfide reductase [Marinomonas transparens]
MIGNKSLTFTTALFCSIAFSSFTWAAELTPSSNVKAAPHQSVQLPSYQGEQVSLKSQKGKILLVDFWASWCGPCRESFPWMTNIQAKYKDQGLKIIAINLDQAKEQALDFLKEYKPGFTVLFDSDALLPEDFGVIGMPTSYLIDRQGNIRATHIGFHNENLADYESAITQLLAEKGE